MKIYSIYPTMVQSAEIIPPDVNVKLILRHSYRPSIKGIDNSDNISLTIKGKEMAFKFGLGLCCPIGVIYSSQLLRCIQTCQFILKGTCISNTTTINTIDMRRFYSSDLVLSEKTFHQEKNGKLVVSKMLNNDILPGFSTTTPLLISIIGLCVWPYITISAPLVIASLNKCSTPTLT